MKSLTNLINKPEWPKNTLTFLVCSVLFIWCIPDTIALRNGLLLLGMVNAVYLIILYRRQFSVFNKKYLPLFFLGCIYLWAVLHYEFFSLNPALELSELRSIWLRALAGSLMAVALPFCLVGNQRRSNFFFIFLFSTPVINIFLYICACVTSGYVITPQEYVAGFVFKKIETVFFGSIATAIAAANLIAIFIQKDRSQSIQTLSVGIWLLGIAICFVSAVVSNTKNGILIGLFVAFLAGGYFLLSAMRGKSDPKIGAILVLGLIVFSLGAWKIHDHFSTGGWNSLLTDVKTAIDVDNHSEWRAGNFEVLLPLNENGVVVSGSTYMRVAWSVVGIRLIKMYPFGYGSINGSYHGLTNHSGIDPGKHGQTHSGWVDFGLAYGIPGLLLLAGTLFCIIWSAFPNPSIWQLQALFIALTVFPLALIAEITWKQYFEATLFFVTYAAILPVVPEILAKLDPPKR